MTLCGTCLPEAGDAFAAELRGALDGAGLAHRVEIRMQDCLNVCGQPLGLALQGPGRATYIFAGVLLPQDLGDLISTIEAYLEAESGWIEDARACGQLRFCLRARVRAWPM